MIAKITIYLMFFGLVALEGIKKLVYDRALHHDGIYTGSADYLPRPHHHEIGIPNGVRQPLAPGIEFPKLAQTHTEDVDDDSEL